VLDNGLASVPVCSVHTVCCGGFEIRPARFSIILVRKCSIFDYINDITKDRLIFMFMNFFACRERQPSIVLERYFRFEISLFSILCMLIARMEMGTSRVLGDSDIIT